MSTTFVTAPTVTSHPAERTATPSRRRVWRVGVAAGLAGSAANCIAVLLARTGGVDVAVDGQRIALVGFVMLTMVGSLAGIALAAVLGRRTLRPRATFVRATVVLTGLSIVPDVLVTATTASKAVLAATHVLAAAIIVPSLAARLAR
jgi:hypothetical protein